MSAGLETLMPEEPGDFMSGRGEEIGRFLEFIDSGGGFDRSSGRHGAVVFNRMAGSLATLQRVCAEAPRRPYLHLTARYRLISGSVFGTLFAALLTDLQRILREGAKTDLIGTFLPDGEDPQWRTQLEPLLEVLDRWRAGEEGIVEMDLVDQLFGRPGEATALNPGVRLVLFVEVYGSDGDSDAVAEWRMAQELLFSRLPDRVALVLAGVPEGFTIPEGPDFLEIALAEDDILGDDAAAVTTYRYAAAPLHSDRPTTNDGLGIQDYAAALARFILHKETRPPLTIGIHGPWGKGKSSFMEMIDLSLVSSAPSSREAYDEYTTQMQKLLRWQNDPTVAWASADEKRKRCGEQVALVERSWQRVQSRAKDDVLSIRFNAWQFQDATQTWAGLAHVISEKLERALPWWRRMALRGAYAWSRRRSEVILNLLPLGMIIVTAIILLLIPEVRQAIGAAFTPGGKIKEPDGGGDAGDLLRFIFPAGSIFALVWALAWRVNKVVQPVSERVADYMKRPDYKMQMGYQHKVMEDLQFVHRHLRRCRCECRIVVYVDDLDRCSDEKIMEILQAANLILANCDFFVFLGMDTAMIHRAIRSHYQKDDTLPETFAEQYLRKILQLSFHLPETPSARLFELASNLFSQSSREVLVERSRRKAGETGGAAGGDADRPDGTLRFDMSSIRRHIAVEDVQDTPDELEVFRDYQRFLSDNPREIKRLVNVHRLVKILMQRSNSSWSVGRQRLLTKWLIFCSRWPELVDDVLTKARDVPDAGDALQLLIDELDLDAAQIGLLREFAGPNDRFSAATCREFAPAAQISQMLHVSAAPRSATPA